MRILQLMQTTKDRILGMPADEAKALEARRPPGAAGLAGGLAAAGVGSVLAGTLAIADPRVIGIAQQSGFTIPGASAGLFMVALGGLMILAAWGVWLLRIWGWWATLALALVALGLTFGTIPWMLGALVLIVYLADIRGVFEGKGGNNDVGARPTF